MYENLYIINFKYLYLYLKNIYNKYYEIFITIRKNIF